ncbi:MAG: phosphomannomutase/phosphoglucomutase [Spirochaetia bacterium]|nr:phosphomannomutase/phosphoglucomutase [Spirochaetia bacterium]
MKNEAAYQYNGVILKACDIRGVVDSELTGEGAYHIGRAFGTILQNEGLISCAVGYDGRITSPELTENLISGLTESGIEVLFAGLVPTPLIYHIVKTYPADSGVIVTASHNPPEYNGFKFLFNHALFHADRIQQLAKISRDGAYLQASLPGSVVKVDMVDRYIAHITSALPEKGLKVVWDPGNGASAAIIHRFIEKLPGDHLVICGTVDGSFPNHHPDPCQPGNMKMLSEKVLSEHADLGIGFDGDGDRIGVIDGKGRFVTGDHLLVIFARDYLKNNPGESVMSEVKVSSFFYQDVLAHGGKPVMWKVGHAYQKEKMQNEGIGFAGETSGHIFFRDNFGFDDGMFSAVKLLNILDESQLSLAEIIDTFPPVYATGELRLELELQKRLQLIEEIKGRLINANRDVIDIDGVRVCCNSGFWNLRSSNTQPHITIYCESESETGLAACRQEMVEQVEASGYVFTDLVVDPIS